MHRLLAVAVVAVGLGACSDGETRIPYSELKQHVAAGAVDSVSVSEYRIEAVSTAEARRTGAPERWVSVPAPDDAGLIPLLERHGVVYGGEAAGGPSPVLGVIVLLIGAGLVLLLVRIQRKGGLQTAFGTGKMELEDAAKKDQRVRFTDVAGVDEAKEELEEVVAFLKDPERFARLGARVPKGVLLVGPPGTGKTLLARAVAGEAGVPFFSISGAEFVEVYVGVGAARARRLFKHAKEQAPCIVFIDELDAIGKSRGRGLNSNDEREQTLNQLLVEMDGFEAQSGIIVMAATNRPEILDPALLRPGRFDRRVSVHPPDRAGREAILQVHARNIRLDAEVDLDLVARKTPGFAGADLENLLNEAALLAARKGRAAVGMAELDAALDRVIAGHEKKGRLIHEKERHIVAVHEAGHAIVAERRRTAGQVQKISIIPRAIGALGFTQQLPDDRNLLQYEELLDRLAVLLGGRAAERIVFGQVSTGASNDLERATQLARRMVCEFGMSEVMGPVRYAPAEGALSSRWDEPGGVGVSGATAREIDREVQALLADVAGEAQRILEADRAVLDAVTGHLLRHEVMERDELLAMLDRAEAAPAQAAGA